MGLPVKSAVYRFAVTMERYSDLRTLKLRVIIVAESDLASEFAPASRIEVPNPLYAVRLKTIQAMHDLHQRAGQPGVMKLGRVVLAVRT